MENPFSIKGKKILITGASSGIGKATAVECSKLGASVIITGRNKERLNETFIELVGVNHQQIVADLTNNIELQNLLSKVEKLDGLIISSGIVELKPIQFITDDLIDKIYTTNVFAPINIIKNIIKYKKYNAQLSIVVIDSIAGTYQFVIGNSIYGSSKAALSSFIKFSALELAKKGIRINSISPGMIKTPMHLNGSIEEEKIQQAIDNIPLKRWGLAEEVGYTAIFLLSKESAYITGSDIKIDGGRSLV